MPGRNPLASIANAYAAEAGETFSFVSDFGGVCDGVTDDGPALRNAMYRMLGMGGGRLILPPATILVGTDANPENSSYLAGAFIPGNVTLQGAGRDATRLLLAPSSPDGSKVLMNYHIQSGTDENIRLIGLTVDGNAQNQSFPTVAGKGWYSLRLRNLLAQDVRFKDVYGTANSGSLEGFAATFDIGTDAQFIGCEALGTTPNTSSGFSANYATNVAYLGCTARGMGASHGFTHAFCAGMAYDSCFSYLNFGYGFNSENSLDVRYAQCRAGGSASPSQAWPYTAGQSLGNGQHGFVGLTSYSLSYINCVSRNNGVNGAGQGSGLFLSTYTQGSGIVQWLGGEISGNSQYGITTGPGADVRLGGGVIFGSNASGDIRTDSVTRSSAYGAQTAPAVPASTTAQVNYFCMPCLVYVTGGTVSAVAVDGVTVGGASPGLYYVRAGGTITLTYSVAPTWSWISTL